ncbi:ATP-binding cassette domain-containing protein [Schleiferia thermophila]|jgi:ABC-type sugar transport system ATPase subunit|nr:hypothetical protein CEN47_13120 [Fischerella thermalis CCMEE 5319]GCD80022.1 hypothetical protein JCM30197_12690 [Schleiferia thermophila]
MDMEVVLRGITFGYQPERLLFDGLNAEFESNKTHVLLGKSGSGKSTLLKILSGDLNPQAGTISSDGQPWHQSEDSVLPGYRHVAFLNQEFDLLPFCTTKENIRRRLSGYSPEEEEEIIRDVSIKLDIKNILNRRATDISGGQKQRVAFAAALARRPKILLLDEPLSNQDFENAENIKDILQYLRGRKTLIITAHEESEALGRADAIHILDNGCILQKDTPERLFEHPKNELCASLLGYYNKLPKDWIEINFKVQIPENGDEYLFTRPHHWVLNKTFGLPCHIMRSEYQGMYHMVLVEVDSFYLYVFYPGTRFEPQDRWKVAYQGFKRSL